MAARRGRLIVLLFGIGLALAVWRMVVVERQRQAAELQRQEIAEQYAQASKKVEALQQEQVQLNTQLVEARQTVEGQAGKINSLEQELQDVDKHLNDTLAELAAIKREHDELVRNHASLTGEYQSIQEEKKQLEFRLSSLKELKKAMKLAKKEIWNKRLASWREYIEKQRQADQDLLASGNRGFLVRNGVATAKATSQLQVHVLEPQPQ